MRLADGHHLRRCGEHAGQPAPAARVAAAGALRGRHRRGHRAVALPAARRERAAGAPGAAAAWRSRAGGRALRRIVVPVLEDALERSLALAASMDARGYGRAGELTSGSADGSRERCSSAGLLGTVRRAATRSSTRRPRACWPGRCSLLGLAARGRRVRSAPVAGSSGPATGRTAGASPTSSRRRPASLSPPACPSRSRLPPRRRRPVDPGAAPALVRARARWRSCVGVLPAVATPAPVLHGTAAEATAMIEWRDLTFRYAGRARPADPARRRRSRSTSRSWCSSPAAPAPGSRRLLRTVNGLVPHFSGGHLER